MLEQIIPSKTSYSDTLLLKRKFACYHEHIMCVAEAFSLLLLERYLHGHVIPSGKAASYHGWLQYR